MPIPQTLISNECLNSLSEIINDITSGIDTTINAGKKKISANYYRGQKLTLPDGSVVQDVAYALGTLYEWKCAFCESKRYKPQVEHFRPKKRVTGPAPNPLGYYWLCYSWTNLLPTCKDCNESKLNSFPINQHHNRVFTPSYLLTQVLDQDTLLYQNSPLIDEEPLLIHPEYVNPEVCFSFNFKGEIRGIDAEGRGEMTKNTMGLDSKDLNFFRQKEIDICVEMIELAILYDVEQMFNDVLNKIRSRALNTAAEYTLLYKQIYIRFEELILPILPFPVQAIVIELYLNNRDLNGI
ncbi:MAG: HNH endonuclease [Bacteroidetes bacterium]|nr:HNH endonuclease [Bacteroidota bacterium]